MGRSLLNGGSYFLRKRRERTLEREPCFVNGTLVASGLVTPHVTAEPPIFTLHRRAGVSLQSARTRSPTSPS